MQITLCLSGGGFRATIFHLGVIDFLVQTGQIEFVKAVFGVSGGAITAAHLAHRWADYKDRKLFHKPAIELLQFCHSGILNGIASSNLLWHASRSKQLEKALEGLFESPLAEGTKPTYVICSNLVDMSQYAVEIKSRRLFRLEPNLKFAGEISATKINTAKAVAMSTLFPGVFEPTRLTASQAGCDAKIFGDEKLLADGGIVDNLGIAMAQRLNSKPSDDHLFLVSDASQIFDFLDTEQKEIGAILCPFRAIDHLMAANSKAITQSFVSSKAAGARIKEIRLADVRNIASLVDEIGVDRIYPAIRTRTTFDSFTFAEITTLYRLGVAVAANSVPKAAPVNPCGLIYSEKLGDEPLNAAWKDVNPESRSTSIAAILDLILRKPGLLLDLILFALFIFCVAVGAFFESVH